MKQANPSGWSAVEEYTADGRIHFEQSARLPAPAVDQSEDGAHELAERYWREVEASTFRLVRTRRRCEGLDLRLLGRWTLLSFGRPETLVDRSAVSSRFPILGGALARMPGGSITFAQTAAPELELRARLVRLRGARPDAAETVAREASAAGLHQIVYLGGLGDDAPGLSPHLRSRIETGRALASGTVPVTTLRAAMIVGPGSAAFETILALVHRLPVMVCPRWVSTPTQPIAIDDAVAYLAAVCGREECLGQSYDIGGPEVMTYREMIERIAAVRGRRPLIVEVPMLTPRLSSYWFHLVTPVGANVARPLIEGLRNPTIVTDDGIRRLIPLELTPFDTAVRNTLSQRPPA